MDSAGRGEAEAPDSGAVASAQHDAEASCRVPILSIPGAAALRSNDARTPDDNIPHESRQIAPVTGAAESAAVGGVNEFPERGDCGLCDGTRQVAVVHRAECMKSQWFDGRTAPDCEDVCPRADCPACHPAAVGEGSR